MSIEYADQEWKASQLDTPLEGVIWYDAVYIYNGDVKRALM